MSDVERRPFNGMFDVVQLWDSAVWLPSVVAATCVRYDTNLFGIDGRAVLTASIIACALQLLLGVFGRRVTGRQLPGSMADALDVARIAGLTGVILTVAGIVGIVTIPRTAPLIAVLFALTLSLGLRLGIRTMRERRARPDAESAARVIVFGAGVGGQHIVRSMLSDAESGYLPVAVLDDDPATRGRRICGIPVRGSRQDIVAVSRSTGAELLVIAVRDLDADALREVTGAASTADIGVKVIPALTEMFRPHVDLHDLRDLDITDIIGRTPVEVDVAAIAGYLRGRKVLVTGAGGSIGSELCRQLRRFEPAQLMMLDRDESALHALQLSMDGRALLDSPDVILADIRDAPTMNRLFAERAPDVVFHAAALKHLPMLEQYPHEAWQSNVVGTHNVLDAALQAGVPTFVNISTDKAANPTSVLGYSKRIGERLVADAARRARGPYVSVRFGNVLGSRGSVVTTFAEQIANNGPVTVTHPEVTRFFMTIPEAVRLVIQAGAIGNPGEAMVLDMGKPVRIADLAQHLIDVAGRPVDIMYTGLREGEKLNEVLFGAGEHDVRPAHPAVSHVSVPALDPARVLQPVESRDAAAVMMALTTAGSDVPATSHQPVPLSLQAGRAGPAHDQLRQVVGSAGGRLAVGDAS